MKRPMNDLERMRAQELLVQRATEGVDDEDAAELERLDASDVLSFDLAAAAVDLATLPREELPPELAAKILASALAAPSTSSGSAPEPAKVPSPTAPAVPAVAASLPEVAPPRLSRRQAAWTPAADPARRRTTFVPWAAAAAGLVLAAGAWWWAAGRDPTRSNADDVAAPPPALARQELIAGASDEVTWGWTRTGDAAAPDLRGDVVWSPGKQQGFARFVGLAPNDRARHRYQLWIVDQTRDPRFPVDGGLFDVDSTAEVVVRIGPRVAVGHAIEFLVTLEDPGGAVVSKRERLVARAAVSP